MNILLARTERFSPVPYIDVHVALITLTTDVVTALRRTLRVVGHVLGVTRVQTRQQHARSRYVVRWPELVIHYAVALFVWSTDNDTRDNQPSAIGRVARVVVASIVGTALFFLGMSTS